MTTALYFPFFYSFVKVKKIYYCCLYSIYLDDALLKCPKDSQSVLSYCNYFWNLFVYAGNSAFYDYGLRKIIVKA